LALRHLNGDPSAATRALHNTFKRVHAQRLVYDFSHSVEQWLFVTAKSEIHFLSHGSRRVEFAEEVKHLTLFQSTSPNESFSSHLKQRVEDLDEEETEILRKRYEDGLAFEEIADALGINAEGLIQKWKWRFRRWRRGL